MTTPTRCSPGGKIGFTFQVIGTLDPQAVTAHHNTNFMYFLGQRSTRRTVSSKTGVIDGEAAGNTITYTDTRYRLQRLQIIKPTPVAQCKIPGMPTAAPVACLLVTLTKATQADIGENVILLYFPLFDAATTNESGFVVSAAVDKYLAEAAAEQGKAPVTPSVRSATPFFEEGAAARNPTLEYVSCLDREGKNHITIRHIIFAGHVVKTATLKALPIATLPGAIDIDASVGAGAVQAQAPDILPIAANATLFIYNHLKLRSSGASAVSPQVAAAAQKYKCMPIDAMRDVRGEMLLVDPTTGEKTLGETAAQDVDAASRLLAADVPQLNVKKVDRAINIVLIVLACLVGAVVACALFLFASRFFRAGGGSVAAQTVPAAGEFLGK